MTRNEYERTIQNQKQTIDQLETKLRELGEQFAEAAKAPPKGCKRGAWCAACAWNTKAAGPYYMIGACTLGACNNFVKRENPGK